MSLTNQRLKILLGLLCTLLTVNAYAQGADLVLSMTPPTTVPPTRFVTGSDIAYTINVANEGAGDAANVVVTNILSRDVTLKSCTATVGALCKIDSADDRVVTVSFDSIAGQTSPTVPPATVAVTLVATVRPGANCADLSYPISNSASVTTSSPESKEDNNSATVTIMAVNPLPAIGPLTASPNSLWPPNHKMVGVAVDYSVTDSCGPVTCSPLGVTSNEPVNGTGDGNTSPDWGTFDDHHVQLRAERAGGGSGRIYTVTATCENTLRLSSGRSTAVWVPHDSSGDVGPGVKPILYGAVLPASRAARVGSPVTVYATIINAGTFIGTGCSIGLPGNIPATLSYQTTNPQTNALTGSPNAPVDIDAGASQSFVVTVTPSATLDPADIQLNFTCANASPAGSLTGINTLLLSAWTTPTPDVVALVATTTGDGIANIPGPWGTGFFAVATSNVGSSGSIIATADTGATKQPVDITLCQTNPATGNCLQQPAPSIPVSSASGETSTFAVFVRGSGKNVAFDPAGNRVFFRLRNAANGAVVGATSVALRTP